MLSLMMMLMMIDVVAVAVSALGDAPVSLILGGEMSHNRSYIWRLDSATLVLRTKTAVPYPKLAHSIARPLALMRRREWLRC
jgi:hypothetical protein